MPEHHYIVSNNDGVWQFSALGNTYAHFRSEQEAIDAAIQAAKESGEPEAEVIVRGAATSGHPAGLRRRSPAFN